MNGSNGLAYGAVLVTPIVLGTTIDAVFTGESVYALVFVPGGVAPDRAGGVVLALHGERLRPDSPLDDSRVAQRGTHEELLAADGLYATLRGVQAGDIEELPQTVLDRTATPPSAATPDLGQPKNRSAFIQFRLA